MFHHPAWAVGSYNSAHQPWEHLKSKSTQPNSETTRITLYMAAPCPFWLPALWHVINMTFCQHILSAPLARLGSKAVVIKLRICRIQHLFMLKVLLPNGPQSPPNIIMYRVLRNLQRQHSVLYCILRLEREKGKIASHPDSQLDLQNCA